MVAPHVELIADNPALLYVASNTGAATDTYVLAEAVVMVLVAMVAASALSLSLHVSVISDKVLAFFTTGSKHSEAA